ncbi:MAG TPA: hypothetical protein VKK79_24675, partial [Candidatus Lokiarchaeia archaeon]|nr:hypothetical protein [Candidatus Lokiarchaeia archaeon]
MRKKILFIVGILLAWGGMSAIINQVNCAQEPNMSYSNTDGAQTAGYYYNLHQSYAVPAVQWSAWGNATTIYTCGSTRRSSMGDF